jgi:hypothetical protein
MEVFKTKSSNHDGANESAGGSSTGPAIVSSELTYIAREVADDHSVVVKIGPKGGGSYADLESRTLTLAEDQVETDGRFVAAHEGAHLRDTATFKEIGVSPAVLAKNLGLLALKNVVEDCCINDRLVRDFQGLAKDTLAAYPRKTEEVGFLMHPEVQAQAQALGFVPRYAQALAALLQDWTELRHTLGFNAGEKKYKSKPYMGPSIKDPHIRKFLDVVLEDFRSAVAMKYPQKAGGEEILDAAKKRHIWCQDVLYPELAKLLEQDLKEITEKGPQSDQANKKSDKGDQGQGEEKGQDGEGQGQDGEDQGESQDGQDQGQDGEGKGEGQGQDGEGQGEGQGKGQDGEGQGQDGEDQGESQDGQGQGQDGKADGSQSNNQSKNSPAKNANKNQNDGAPEKSSDKKDAAGKEANSLSAEEIAEAIKKHQQLPLAERKRMAREALAQFDDAVREALKSLFDKQEEVPTATEVIREINQAESQAEAEAQMQAYFQHGGKGLRDSVLRNLSPYQTYYHDVVPKIDEIEGRLKDAFIPNMHFKWERAQPTGQRITMIEAMRFDATGEGAETLFERRIDPTRPDIGIIVMIDRSGSMQGDKIGHAVRATVFTKEIFQRIGVKCAVVGFANEQEILASFDDDTAELTTQENIIRGLYVGGGTQDAAALQYSARLLMEERFNRGAIVVISDAQSGEGAQLAPLVKAVEQAGIPVIHFGIGADTVDQGGYYTRSFGGLEPSGAPDRNFFDVFASEMEKLAYELL